MTPQPDQLFAVHLGTLAALLGLALLIVTCAAYLVSVARDVRTDVKRVHLQQANIVGMLLRAGFRPAHGDRDWLEDAAGTQLPLDAHYTRFDWRSPEQRHGR